MIDSQESYNKELIKHLNKLFNIAKEKQPTELLAKIERYYKGTFSKPDKVSNQRNVIKGIVEAKTTLVIDSQIKTAVIPKTKNMADPSTLETVSDIATIFDDCVKDVFNNNSFDGWRQMCVRDLVKKIVVNETYWDAEDSEIKLRRIPYSRFFPDPSCVNIEDGNFHFIEEPFSPITLKAKYPQYADKIAKYSSGEKGDKDKENPAGVVTATSGDKTSQAYSYGDPSNIADNAKTIIVRKCYLKDDTTFTAEESEKNTDNKDIEIIKKKYPKGRVVMYIGDSKDIVLEDKPLDYEFGYPLDVCYNIEGDSIWECQGDVEPLFENQNRINNAYVKAKEMVGKAGSWLLNDPKNSLKKSDFVNKTVLEIENMGNPGNVPQLLVNNTIDKFNLMIDYMEMLKKDSLDIARLNEQMVSGTQDETTTSGEQVKALNESPMTGIRTLQRNYKEFLISVTNKIISLIQQYYTEPRIIRISDNKFMYIPTRGQIDAVTGQQMQMQEYTNNDGVLSVTKEINGNLGLGRYEVEVIAGSEKPRSRSENANLMMMLYQIGMLGQSVDTISELLEELDVPNRKQIVDRLRKQEESAPMPTIFDNPDLAKNFSEIFGKIEGFTAAKRVVLQKNGLPDTPDSLVDAPVQEVTKESDLEGVAEIAPILVSPNPREQIIAQQKIDENQAMDKKHEMATIQMSKQDARPDKK